MFGIGTIQRRTKHALIARWPEPARVSDLLEYSYPRVDAPKRWHRKSMYRALRRWGVNVGRGLWAPNAELAEQISPKKH
jgi:hypothetical protein